LPAQALYLKWRPRTFDDVIGQQHITQTLRNAIIQDLVRHAYLFNGPRGTGKTTMARILAKAVNCQHDDPAVRPCDACLFCQSVNDGRFLDLIEIDAASHNGVDDVRDLREKIAFAPSEGRFKVYIIDEVHRFSGAAFDALLKTLEEPPDHAIFILATTELDKVPATIKSRSLTFEFRRVSLREVVDRLQLIIEGEGVKAEREALELVARHGTGSVRDSISLLDQMITNPDEAITLEIAEQILGTAGNRAVGKLVQAILENNVATGLDVLNQAIDEGADPAQFGRQIVEYLRNVLLVQTGGPSLVDVSEDLRTTLQQQAATISRTALVRAVRAFNTAVGELRGGWQPQLPLELALIESTRPVVEEIVQVEVTAPRAAAKAAPAKTKAEPTPEPEPEAEPAEAGAVSLGDLQRMWPAIHKAIKDQNKALGALLDHASLKAIEGNLVTLAVTEAVFKGKLEAEDKKAALAKILKATFKAPLQIKVIVGGAAAAQSRNAQDAVPDNDDLLSFVTSDLGGTVTDVEDSPGGLD
jgi:DNA polymerase-3 subunit gamma/tau